MTKFAYKNDVDGPENYFYGDDDLFSIEEPLIDNDRMAVSHFKAYSRSYNSELMEEDLDIIQGMNEQISPEIRELIENLRAPKALVGMIFMDEEDYPVSENNGPVNEKEIKLFQHVNTILQDPRCVYWRDMHFPGGIQKIFALHITRYVLYIAQNTALDEKNFKIDGHLMKDCVKYLLENENTGSVEERMDFEEISFICFRSALTVLQFCLGIVHTGHLGKKERVRQMKNNWMRIPRIDVVTKFWEEKQQKSYLELKAQYPDKNRFAIVQPRYMSEEHREMMINMLKKTSTGNIEDIHDGVCAIAAFALGHHYLFRGHNMQLAELSDTVYSVEKTRHGNVPVLGFQCHKDKRTDINNKTGLTGACRNKDLLVCPLMAISMSYWYQLDFESEHGPLTGKNFPNFQDNSNWNDRKVLFCDNNKLRQSDPISATKLNNLFEKCLDSIGFETLHKAHVGRFTNAIRADAFGVSQTQIWRQDSGLDSVNSSHVPAYAFDFIHYSGGFTPDEAYSIPRNIPVPEDLQRLIFPWLEDTIAKLNDVTHHLNLPNSSRSGPTMEFLAILKLFRSIIIQDLALLVDVVPDCIFAKHPIVSDPRFLAFKNEVEQAVEPSYQSFPIDSNDRLAHTIKSKFDDLSSKISILQKRQAEAAQAELLATQRLGDALARSIVAGLKDQLTESITEFFKAQRESHKAFTDHVWNFISDGLFSVVNGDLGSQIAAQVMEQLEDKMPYYIDRASRRFGSESSSSDQTTKRKKIQKEPPPHLRGREFRLSKELVSISAVWQEWFISQPGQLSISEKNEKYNTSWRCDQEDPYKRRVRIINFIGRIEKELNVDSEKAVELLETYYKDHCSDMKSLNTSLTHKPLADKVFDAIKTLASSN